MNDEELKEYIKNFHVDDIFEIPKKGMIISGKSPTQISRDDLRCLLYTTWGSYMIVGTELKTHNCTHIEKNEDIGFIIRRK